MNCRLYGMGHCPWCRSHPEWRAEVKMPDVCPDNWTPDAPARPLPGTELKRLLAKLGIEAEAGCQCNAMAKRMDAGGPEWCLEHVDEILKVMRKEASWRGLPFSDHGARFLIRFAVWRSERANALQSDPS